MAKYFEFDLKLRTIGWKVKVKKALMLAWGTLSAVRRVIKCIKSQTVHSGLNLLICY